MKIVQIENVGNVGFPDSMSDEQIGKAAGEVHAKANLQQPRRIVPQTLGISHVVEFLASREQGEIASEHLKKLSGVAKLLEEHPALAQLAIAGLQSITK